MRKIPITVGLILTAAIHTYSLSLHADELINSCDKCHGENGISEDADVPSIAGMSSAYLEASMAAYTDGSRTAREYGKKDMKTIVAPLSANVLKKLADHYSSLPFVAAKQEFDSTLAASGKKVHNRYCEKCHTEGGSLAEDDSGILAGQWQPYLLEEMQQYQSGGRSGDRKMISTFKGLTEENVKELAEFYASQQ
jgi:sulfide dehydrogenase cytochrome subunit